QAAEQHLAQPAQRRRSRLGGGRRRAHAFFAPTRTPPGDSVTVPVVRSGRPAPSVESPGRTTALRSRSTREPSARDSTWLRLISTRLSLALAGARVASARGAVSHAVIRA